MADIDINKWQELAQQAETMARWLRPILSIADIPKAIESSIAKVSQLEDAEKSLKASITKLEKDLKDKTAEFGKVDGKVKELYDQKTAIMEAEITKKYDTLSEKLADLQREFDGLSARKVTLARQIDDLNQKSLELQGNISDLENKKAKLEEFESKMKELLGK